MIYVATVHYRSAEWIEVQTDYLRRHISEPFHIWASMEGVETRYHRHVDRVIPAVGRHAGQLNLLAQAILREAQDDDVIIFIDGDAFPIADPLPAIRSALSSHPLVAIRRDENLGDPQPHPSFCATTAGFWRSLPGDWSGGAPWINAAHQQVSDVGGNLHWLLKDRSFSWQPLLRSNRRNLHPLWFGIYGGIIYHHGASFRERVSRLDKAVTGTIQGGRAMMIRHPLRFLRLRKREAQANAQARLIEHDMRIDPDFFRQFM
jgi:hypothetical protein